MWVGGERERFNRMLTRAMEARVEVLHAEGRGRQAIEAADSLVARDPLREDWQRQLLQLYARYNCREVALSHADEFVSHLRRELGAEPEPATQELIERILRNELSAAQAAVLPQSATEVTGAEPAAGAAVQPPSQERTPPAAVLARLFPGDSRGRTAIVLSGVALCASLLAFGMLLRAREEQPAQTIAEGSD